MRLKKRGATRGLQMTEQEANRALTVAEEKRLAIQLAAQLPEDTKEAVAVLDYAKELVLTFLQEPAPVKSGV